MKIALREARPEDWPAIVDLHCRQQQKQKTNYELPPLFGPQIPLALAAVDEAGAVRGCVYVERVAEMRFVGSDPRVTAGARREIAGFRYLLEKLGYRWCECFVPRRLAGRIGRPLGRAGFACVDEELSHFTLDLRNNGTRG